MFTSRGLGLLCAEELIYSKCYVVTFYGVGWKQSAECKSGSLEKGEKEVAGIANYGAPVTTASKQCYIRMEL